MGVPSQVFEPTRLAAVQATGLLDTPADEAFDRFSRLAAALLNTPFAFVTVVDETRSFWKSCIGVDATDPADRQNPVEESFCQYVIGSREPLVVGDARTDPLTRDNPSIESMGVIAWAGFPVWSPEGQVLGTFCVVDTTTREWSEQDIHVLDTLSQAVAGEIALRSALEDSRRASLELLRHDQEMTALVDVLQESLVPQPLPDVPGLDAAGCYLPAGGAAKVSGDFFDLFPVPQGWAIVIGDVEGHGVLAARTTSMARHTVRAAAQQQPSPAEVLRSLDQAARATGLGEKGLLSAIFVRMRPTDGGWTGLLARGGHPYPLILRHGGTIDTVESDGPLLGHVANPSFANVPIELARGDLLVLHTDGLTDVGPAGDRWGDGRLHACLKELAGQSADDIARSVVAASREHAGEHLTDDIAVVVVGPLH